MQFVVDIPFRKGLSLTWKERYNIPIVIRIFLEILNFIKRYTKYGGKENGRE